MGKFVIKRRLSLDFLGEGWEQAYINFTNFGGDELRNIMKLEKTAEEDPDKMLDVMIKMLKDHFIDGKGFDGNGLVDFEKDDMAEIALDIYVPVIKLIQGSAANPKS